MNRLPIALAGTALCAIASALAYHHHAAAPAPAIRAIEPPPVATSINSAASVSADTTINEPTPVESSAARDKTLEYLLDAVIADAIQRGTLDPSRLSAKQLALLPEKFRPKPASSEYVLTPEQVAHVEEQLALGDKAPPDPEPPFPCPDPNHLPENYNNAYNKMILRERGCKL